MAAVDPITAAWINAGSNVLGKALSTPAAAPAGPSSAGQSNPYNWGMDSSGWNVNFGSGSIDSQASKQETSGTNSASAMNWQMVALIGLGVVAVWAAVRRR